MRPSKLALVACSALMLSCGYSNESSKNKNEATHPPEISSAEKAKKEAEKRKEADAPILAATAEYLGSNYPGWKIAGTAIGLSPSDSPLYCEVLAVDAEKASDHKLIYVIAVSFVDSAGTEYWRVDSLTPQVRALISPCSRSESESTE